MKQYRTRERDGVWGEWQNLPGKLLFSHYYMPAEFEFRELEISSPISRIQKLVMASVLILLIRELFRREVIG